MEISNASEYSSINKRLSTLHFTLVYPPEYYDELLKPLPMKEDKVVVKGIVSYNEEEAWYEINPVEDMTFVHENIQRNLAQEGEACSNDMDCLDNLICYQDQTCGRVQQVWGFQGCLGTECEQGLVDGFRRNDLYGSCNSNDECPAGQECRTDVTPLVGRDDDNPWGVVYSKEVSVDRYLCYPINVDGPVELEVDDVCSHVYDVTDFLAGQFAPGKDICLQGTVFGPIPATDGDTHIQIFSEIKGIYPVADFTIDAVGIAANRSSL